MDPLRMRQGTAGDRCGAHADASPRQLRRRPAVARTIHQGALWRTEPHARADSEQRVLSPDDERHLPTRPGRGGGQGGQPGLGELPGLCEDARPAPRGARASHGEGGA